MKIFLATLFLCFFSISAQAQDDRYFNSSKIYKVENKKSIKYTNNNKKYIKYVRNNRNHKIKYVSPTLAYGVTEVITAPIKAVASVIGGRPSGCPHRFCGCALSLNIFGRIVPHLNLAANWLRFPSSAPAPGMVAARHGHVFKLLSHVEGSMWKVFDANSGGGRIRIHNRSINGFKIVNPNGNKFYSERTKINSSLQS